MPKSASDSSSLAPSRKFDRDMSMPPETQVVIDFDDNRAASALVGPYGQHLAQIAKGLVIDLYRRRQIEAAYLDALARLPQPLAPSAEDCAAAVQALVDIDAVLNGLPPKAREALLLRKLDGMSYRDIATRLRVSVSSVEKYVATALLACCQARLALPRD